MSLLHKMHTGLPVWIGKHTPQGAKHRIPMRKKKPTLNLYTSSI